MNPGVQINSIVVMGAGNVASHLCAEWINQGFNVLQVYARNKSSAQELHEDHGIPIVDSLSEIDKTADLYIIAFNDDNIGSLLDFKTENKIVVHTSGTVSSKVLENYSNHYGVFYPLQTFKKGVPVDFSSVPFLVDGSDGDTRDALMTFGRRISGNVLLVTEEDRKVIHLAAVIANNFSNHMWHLAENILKNQGLPFDVLVPLISHSVEQFSNSKPSQLQTGPAIRSDHETMRKQLEMLKDEDRVRQLYDLISKSIQKENE